jgi:lysophospholipase L1-like esterase|tara:strand:+ start:6181 stop:6933 length:753 start_codon:yes stop_codon:yes gene_type:complete
MLNLFSHFSQEMKKLIFLLIPIISFAQEDSLRKTSTLDHLYPKKDLVFQYQDDWGKGNYKKLIEEFKKQPLNYGNIVFLGNSITAGGNDWSERLNYPNIRNRGIGGDVTAGVLARLDELIYFKPRTVLLLIGINDLWNLTPDNPSAEYVGSNILKIVQKIKVGSPQTKIYIQTILPNKRMVLREKIRAVNQIIKSNQTETLYSIIDLYSVFVNDEGLLKDELSIDETHLNEQGYDEWVKFIQPMFILPKK